jgi:hypothetical protein
LLLQDKRCDKTNTNSTFSPDIASYNHFTVSSLEGKQLLEVVEEKVLWTAAASVKAAWVAEMSKATRMTMVVTVVSAEEVTTGTV